VTQDCMKFMTCTVVCMILLKLFGSVLETSTCWFWMQLVTAEWGPSSFHVAHKSWLVPKHCSKHSNANCLELLAAVNIITVYSKENPGYGWKQPLQKRNICLIEPLFKCHTKNSSNYTGPYRWFHFTLCLMGKAWLSVLPSLVEEYSKICLKVISESSHFT
jgi:hypothetical protein